MTNSSLPAAWSLGCDAGDGKSEFGAVDWSIVVHVTLTIGVKWPRAPAPSPCLAGGGAQAPVPWQHA